MQDTLHNFPLLQGGSPPCTPDLKLGRSLCIMYLLYFILKLFGIYPFMQSSAAAAAAAAAAAEAQRIVPSGPH